MISEQARVEDGRVPPELIAIDELLLTGTSGPLTRGVVRATVAEKLGPPSTWSAGGSPAQAEIWVYGDVGRGHLELFFLDDRVRSIFADHLPIRRFRTPQLRIVPGWLGGLTLPPWALVERALDRHDVRGALRHEPHLDPPAPPTIARVPITRWKKLTREVRVEEHIHARVELPSGADLMLGHGRATLIDGTEVASEDWVAAVAVGLLAD